MDPSVDVMSKFEPLLQLGFAGFCCCVLLAGIWWLVGNLLKIQHTTLRSLDALTQAITSIAERMSLLAEDHRQLRDAFFRDQHEQRELREELLRRPCVARITVAPEKRPLSCCGKDNEDEGRSG